MDRPLARLARALPPHPSRAHRAAPSRAPAGPGLPWLPALVLLAAALSAPAVAGAAQAPSRPARVTVDLLGERTAIEPGGAVWLGVRQRIAPGWHTYWLNPGDSGEPMTVAWTLPPGFEVGELVWPHPERIPVGPAMSYGYEREVVVLARLRAPTGLEPGGRVTVKAQASWLVCEKICIPEEAGLELVLPVESGSAPADPRGAPAIARARQAVPAPSPWPASSTVTGETVEIAVAARGLASDRLAGAWFYPARWGAIDHAADQELRLGDAGLTLRVSRGPLAAAAEAPLDGVLVITERLDGATATHAFSIQARPRASPAARGAGAPAGASLLGILGLALAGGLVLNLMPCVLPVLSVKALALARHAGASRAVAAAHGLAYTAGVLVSFGVLAGALLALRAGGAQIGWGFQLQSPPVVVALAYVFFVLGLAMSGAVTIGGRAAGIGHGLADRSGYPGSFFTGALATVAATPCTAPFMGAAMGFAVTASPGVALLVFEALGLGLALPYLALALMPGWRRHLPRPGPWMERLEQLLAFPLYASAAWLVWVLSQQVGPDGVAVALGGFVLIAFAAWLARASRGAGPRWRAIAVGGALAAVVAAGALAALPGSSGWAPPRAADRGGNAPAWEPFTERRLAALRAEGRPVFLNVTAAWCITCLVNERVALRSPAVAAAFAERGIALLKADWTNRDPQIARMLEGFGRSGVPLYVLYAPGQGGAGRGEPTVLPQILSESIVLEAIGAIRQAGSGAGPTRKET